MTGRGCTMPGLTDRQYDALLGMVGDLILVRRVYRPGLIPPRPHAEERTGRLEWISPKQPMVHLTGEDGYMVLDLADQGVVSWQVARLVDALMLTPVATIGVII